ncbi:MAG: dihydrofolate reductase [Proteobacteria bacterium]|nr:dihydrofolate reductase [Pseudomonadota bacterium]
MICKRLFSSDGGEVQSVIRVSMIAAVDSRMGLSAQGRIPWDVPGDRAFFRSRTYGQSVLMGRRTFESLAGRVLEGRWCAVLSHRALEGASRWPAGTLYSSPGLEAALEWCAARADIVYVSGGSEIYRLMMARADELWLSRIEGDFGCDLFFPEIPGCFALELSEPRDGFMLEYWKNMSEA